MDITLQTAIEIMAMNPGNGDICIGPSEIGFMVNEKCRIVTEGNPDRPFPFEADDFYGEKWEIITAKPKTRDIVKIINK